MNSLDMSTKDWETKVRETAETVKMAHRIGVSVESEVGTIGQTGIHVEGQKKEGIYTTPEEARKFVEETGVDTLAVGIDTSHGIYPSDVTPKIRIDILEDIVKAVPNTPLVLHGGSSNPDERIADAVKHGISKVNISSDYKRQRFVKFLPKMIAGILTTYSHVQLKPVRRLFITRMNLFNSVGKAMLYEGIDPWRADRI